MLQKETIEPGTLELLKQLQREPLLHLNTPDTIEEIRLESVPDIIAMKLSAIAHNGSRIKDYIDIANLSTHYSFNTMLEFYTAKFDNANPVMPIKAITYYGEIDFNEPVVMLTDEFDWNKIASRLEQMVAHPDKVFDRRP